jgi:hypothetical protein
MANWFCFLNVEETPVYERNSITWDSKRRNVFLSKVQIALLSGNQRYAAVITVFTVAVKRIKPDLTFVYIYIYTVNFVLATPLAQWLLALFTFIYFSFVARIRASRYVFPWYIRIFCLIIPSITEPPKDQVAGVCQTLLHTNPLVGKECVELHNAGRDTRSAPGVWLLSCQDQIA